MALVLPRKCTILTIHDLVFFRSYLGWKKLFIKWLFLEMPVKRCLYVTTVSNQIRSEILSLIECDATKILVISNPLTFNFIPAIVKFPTQFQVILFIGTTPNKNLLNVIPALFGLQVHLRIIGEISEVEIDLLKKFAISYSSVHCLDDNAIQQEYLQAKVLLFPSHYEGFGLPIIEAFQHGLPVITSNFPPMSDIALDAALFVDPYSIIEIRNAVRFLLNNPNYCYELKLKGYSRLKDFNLEKIAHQYQGLYDSVLYDANHLKL